MARKVRNVEGQARRTHLCRACGRRHGPEKRDCEFYMEKLMDRSPRGSYVCDCGQLRLGEAAAVRHFESGEWIDSTGQRRRHDMTRVNPPVARRRRFVREHRRSPARFDPRSIRTVRRGRHRIITGCPRGQYRRTRCRVGTHAVSVLHPRNPRDHTRAPRRRAEAANPPNANGHGRATLIYADGRIAGKFYGRHAVDGRHYQHTFSHAHVTVSGLADGSIVFKPRRGRLWGVHRV